MEGGLKMMFQVIDHESMRYIYQAPWEIAKKKTLEELKEILRSANVQSQMSSEKREENQLIFRWQEV